MPHRIAWLRISSGFRCRTYNARVGGAPSSYHTLGMAADIVVRDIDMEELARKAALVRSFLDGGIGTYAGWVHVDVRGYGRRWRG